jgi:DNA-binding response OmpR family regulator
MRILVVDDEVRLADGVRRGLEAEGFAVDVAHNGTDGLWRARETRYDVIVLDLMMPGMSGWKVCEALRAEENWTPVLMLTAKDGEWDQVEALETGAVLVRDPRRSHPRSDPAGRGRPTGRARGRRSAARSGRASRLAR